MRLTHLIPSIFKAICLSQSGQLRIKCFIGAKQFFPGFLSLPSCVLHPCSGVSGLVGAIFHCSSTAANQNLGHSLHQTDPNFACLLVPRLSCLLVCSMTPSNPISFWKYDYCVTRAPLLYFIRSWVALSFKVVSQSVSLSGMRDTLPDLHFVQYIKA